MSHKANDVFTDILIDNMKKLDVECKCDECEDTTEALYEQQLEEKENDEWQHENELTPTCGEGFPTWDSYR